MYIPFSIRDICLCDHKYKAWSPSAPVLCSCWGTLTSVTFLLQRTVTFFSQKRVYIRSHVSIWDSFCRPFRVPLTFCKLFLQLCIPSSSSSSSSLSQQLIVLHCHPLWATETHIHTKQGLYLIPNLPAVRHKLQLFAQKPRGWTADSSAASIKMHLQSCSFTCIDS